MFQCHCRDCQKFTGSAFAAVIGLPKSAVTVTGALKGFTKRGDSGKPTERLFCPECGASVMDEAEAAPGLVMIASYDRKLGTGWQMKGGVSW